MLFSFTAVCSIIVWFLDLHLGGLCFIFFVSYLALIENDSDAFLFLEHFLLV